MSHERRVFVDIGDLPNGGGVSEAAPSSRVHLSPTDSHHLKVVLRLDAGAPLVVVDRGTGKQFNATIADLADTVTVVLGAPIERSAHETVWVRSLLFALCKGKRNDLVVEKGTELGVDRIVLWQAERSIVRLTSALDAEKKRIKFQRLAEEASKQSGRSTVPEVVVASSLERALSEESLSEVTGIVCSLSPDARTLREMHPMTKRAAVAVGPEGDLTSQEERLLRERSFHPVSLGGMRLRSETAAIAALSMIQAVGILSSAELG